MDDHYCRVRFSSFFGAASSKKLHKLRSCQQQLTINLPFLHLIPLGVTEVPMLTCCLSHLYLLFLGAVAVPAASPPVRDGACTGRHAKRSE